jgi:DNA ligase-1
VQAESWDALAKIRDESRSRRVEGFMLKRLASPFRVGRPRGDWWKWKIEPLTIDAVMIYAQRGQESAPVFTPITRLRFGITASLCRLPKRIRV